MALNQSGLASELTDLFESQYSSYSLIGLKMATSISDYFQTGIAPGNGVVTTTHGIGSLSSIITNAIELQASSESIPATMIGDGINSMLSTAIILGSPYGTGPISGMVVGGLISDLTDIWANQFSSESIVGTQMANAIHLFTLSGTCFGSGIPPTFISQIGPLS